MGHWGGGGGLLFTVSLTNSSPCEYKKHSKKSRISYFDVAVEFEHNNNTLICWLSSQLDIHPDSRKTISIFEPEILVNCC